MVHVDEFIACRAERLGEIKTAYLACNRRPNTIRLFVILSPYKLLASNNTSRNLNSREIIIINITDTLVLNNQQGVTCAGFLDHYVAGVTPRALLHSKV
jgi:hypothetical protein